MNLDEGTRDAILERLSELDLGLYAWDGESLPTDRAVFQSKVEYLRTCVHEVLGLLGVADSDRG